MAKNNGVKPREPNTLPATNTGPATNNTASTSVGLSRPAAIMSNVRATVTKPARRVTCQGPSGPLQARCVGSGATLARELLARLRVVHADCFQPNSPPIHALDPWHHRGCRLEPHARRDRDAVSDRLDRRSRPIHGSVRRIRSVVHGHGCDLLVQRWGPRSRPGGRPRSELSALIAATAYAPISRTVFAVRTCAMSTRASQSLDQKATGAARGETLYCRTLEPRKGDDPGVASRRRRTNGRSGR